jgi:peptidoglycan/LPS O-acetylase OafA/YrhL
MQPTSHSRIPALDGVRGLATLTVLISHFLFQDIYGQEWWWGVVQSGWMGVDLFFVLSGFLITGILVQKKGKPNYFRSFYWRRLLRIFPLYYLAILFSAFAILVIDQQPHRLNDGYNSLVYYVLFIPNIAMALGNEWAWQTNWVGLAHLWSLAVEEQFYLVWPLIVYLIPKKWLVPLCVAILFAGPYLRAQTDLSFGEHSLASYMLPYCRMDGLAAGSLLALLRQSGQLSFTTWQRELLRDLGFGAGMVVFYTLIAIDTTWRDFFISVMFFVLVYLSMSPTGMVKRFCELPFLMHIGKYSYGMYIFHQMFRVLFETVFKLPLLDTGMPTGLVQVLYILLAVSVSYGLARLSWHFIESRFLSMKDRY